MADVSNVQTDFRAGEWSQTAQGRMDDKEYRRGLNVCLNSYPTEEGAWNRRSGTRFLAYTLNGSAAWLVPFHFSQGAPYNIELTDSFARFFSPGGLVSTNDPAAIASVSTANPAVITLKTPVTWSTGDQVQFLFSQGSDSHLAGPVINRQFVATVITSTTISITDPVTSATIDGSTFKIPTGTYLARVLAVASPYTINDLTGVNWVQAEILSSNVLQGQVILLHSAYAPRVVVNTTPENGAAFAQFTMSAITFTDGPYFDPAPSGTLTPSALSGAISLSGAPTNTFASTDVGRMIRLFSEPAYWASGTGYITGNIVKYTDNNYYTAVANSTGQAPNTHPTLWALNPTGAVWTWGLITAFTSSTQVTFAVDPSQALLYTTPIVTWRLGLYSATTGYPSCGVFHEGRLWLAGAQPNRFDASMSDQPFNFSPTAVDGTVSDSNGISYLFNSDDVNPILWLSPDHQGIIAGTAGGEWMINASNLSDPLTPTSIQAKRVSRYKCANVPPAYLGMALLFVQAQQHRLLEVTFEYITNKFVCHNMTERARHLTGSGIAQVSSQQDLSPIIWARMNDGSFAGMSYRRDSSFSSEPPTFVGWHRHTLGSGRLVESLVSGPNADGSLDTITLVTNDPTTNVRHVEVMTDMFDETTPTTQPWFVDDAFLPTVALENASAGTLQMWGGFYLAGKLVSVSIGGLDIGDFTVAADGSVTVPLAGASTTFPAQAQLTDAYLTAFESGLVGPLVVPVNQDIIVTYPATSQPYVQVYKDMSVVTGTTDQDWAINDFGRDELYTFSSGSTSAAGINVFDRFTGVRKRSVTQAALFATTSYQPSSNTVLGGNSPVVFSPTSQSLFFCSDITNYSVLRKVNGQTLAFPRTNPNQYSYGNSVGLSGIFAHPRSMAVVALQAPEKRRGKKWIYTSKEYLAASDAVVAGRNVVTILKVGDPFDPAIQLRATFTITEQRAQVVAGETFQNYQFSYANIYGLGSPSSVPSTAALGIYVFHIPANADQFVSGSYGAITMTRVGGITPAQVDSTWTHFETVSEPIFDGSDNNIMFFVTTFDSVTNQQYLVKANTSTGAVMWATAYSNAVPNTIGTLSQTYCGSGTFSFVGNHTVYVVTTATGAIASFGPYSLALASGQGQFSDDRDGQIFLEGNFTTGQGINALNGSATETGQWIRLGTGSWGPVTIITVGPAIPQVPMAIGYTFTSQGQRLRPVAPDDSGARNGPGFAKTRRNHKAGLQLLNSTALSIGTQFVDQTKMRPVVLKSDRVNTNPVYKLFSGVTRIDSGLDDDNTFDGMIAWQITRPWPCTVTAIGGFVHTQDL